MNQEGVRHFFDSWSVYDQVVQRNYMFHDEIFRDVARVLTTRFVPGGFTMLDLGCGSARHLSRALAACPPARYLGCDLSDVALGYARQNLETVGCPFELKAVDFFEALRGADRSLDLVFSSFAVHHLSAEEKERLFQEIHRRLKSGGAFLLVDTARRDDEDRPTYLDHYCGWIEADWKDVSREGLDYIFDHIRNNDFPETNSSLQAMARRAGFVRAVEVDQYRWHRTWLFERSEG